MSKRTIIERFPSVRIGSADGTIVEAWFVPSVTGIRLECWQKELGSTNRSIGSINGHAVLVRVCDIKGREWADIITDLGSDIPFICVNLGAVIDRLAVAAGCVVIVYEVHTGVRIGQILSDYPYHAILSSSDGASFFLVHELGITRVGHDCTEKWSFWTPDPIERVSMTGDAVRAVLLDGTSILVRSSDGQCLS